MDNKQRLFEYLNTSPWQKAGALSILKKLKCDNIEIIENGAIFVAEEGLYVATYDTFDALKKIIDLIPNGSDCYFCEYDEKELLSLGVDISHFTPCKQFVYKKKIPYVESSLPPFTFSKLDESFAQKVFENYSMNNVISKEEIARDLSVNESVGAFCDNELAGFVGQHSDGSMGMLEVLSKYKRMGLATELAKRIANKVLLKGETPYGHIKLNNTASFALQNKLDNEYTDKLVAWGMIKK